VNPCWILDVWHVNPKEDLQEWMSHPDEWVELSPGDWTPNKHAPPIHFSEQSIMYPATDNTCLVSSFASALHLAGFVSTAKKLIENIDCLKQGTNLVLNFVHFVNGTKTRNEEGEMMTLMANNHFDIVNGRGPAVVILQGSDCCVTHAIAVFDKYLIDASWNYAMPRTQQCLNWCCSPALFLAPKHVYVLEPTPIRGQGHRKLKRKRYKRSKKKRTR
jgi:hypothetical protein